MGKLAFNLIKKSWSQIAHHNAENLSAKCPYNIHQKINNTFSLGPFYYFLLNIPQARFEYVSESCCAILGLDSAKEFTVGYALSHIHPEDIKRVIKYERRISEFYSKLSEELILQYKVSYDFRIRTKDGDYIWIMQQMVILESNALGAVLRMLGVHTDITHLKSTHTPSGLSFINLADPASGQYVDKINRHPANRIQFSKREKEILGWIVLGKKSREIADILCISLHTVNTHRKKILSKSCCKSPVELALKAKEQAWV